MRRGKSLRNGVHLANAVVWGPVYRTRLRRRLRRRRRAPPARPRLLPLLLPLLLLAVERRRRRAVRGGAGLSRWERSARWGEGVSARSRAPARREVGISFLSRWRSSGGTRARGGERGTSARERVIRAPDSSRSAFETRARGTSRDTMRSLERSRAWGLTSRRARCISSLVRAREKRLFFQSRLRCVFHPPLGFNI